MDDAYHPEVHNQPGSQSSPQAFHLPPTLVAHFPPLPAPSHPTDLLTPFSTGSTSDLFRAIIKRPNPISLEINGELHSNAADVAIQFAAELRVYRKVGKHINFVAYLGCVEGLGVVLEWIEGPTLLDVLRGPPPPPRHVKMAPTNVPAHKNPSKRRRITWYNQLVDALVHLHSLGLNHGDLSLLNIHVETRSDSIKLIDFGRSISVVGYPCQHLYLPDPNDPPTPTVKEAKLAPPPAIFKFGGAWVDDDRDARPGRTGRFGEKGGHSTRSSSHGRDPTRPKLFDRSTPSSSSSTRGRPPAEPEDGVALLGGNLGPLSGDLGVERDSRLSRPVNHASRLLHKAPSSSQLGTHMPVTLSRTNRMSREMGREPTIISRPSSTSPVNTRYHLSSSPMSPRHAYEEDGRRGYDQGFEQDEWMQIDSHAPLSPSSMTSRDYAYPPSRHGSRDSPGYGHYGYPREPTDNDLMHYAQSPPPSTPASRRASRSPGRFPTAAHYANAPRAHRHRSTSRPGRSRSPQPPHHRGQHDYPDGRYSSHHPSPQNDGYYDGGYPDQYSPQTVRGHQHGLRPSARAVQAPPPPPSKPPPKPEQIHPGSRPFCAPEILRAPSGSSIDSRTKAWVDPILADAYSLGIILVCMDLCKLVDVNGEKQKREDGSFPDLTGTTIFTELIKVYSAPAPMRERVSLEKKMAVPQEEDE